MNEKKGRLRGPFVSKRELLVIDSHRLDLIGSDRHGDLAIGDGKRITLWLLHQVHERCGLCAGGNGESDLVGFATPLKEAGNERVTVLGLLEGGQRDVRCI